MTEIENAARWGPAALEGHRDKNSTANIAQPPTPQRVRRSVADFCRAIRQALAREARIAKLAGVPADSLEGISRAWVGRGCP